MFYLTGGLALLVLFCSAGSRAFACEGELEHHYIELANPEVLGSGNTLCTSDRDLPFTLTFELKSSSELLPGIEIQRIELLPAGESEWRAAAQPVPGSYQFSASVGQWTDTLRARALVRRGDCPPVYLDVYQMLFLDTESFGRIVFDKNVVECGGEMNARIVNKDSKLSVLSWQVVDLGFWPQFDRPNAKFDYGFNADYLNAYDHSRANRYWHYEWEFGELQDRGDEARFQPRLHIPEQLYASVDDLSHNRARIDEPYLRSPGYFTFLARVSHPRCGAIRGWRGFALQAADSFRIEGPEVEAEFVVSKNKLCMSAENDLRIEVTEQSAPDAFVLGWHTNMVFYERKLEYYWRPFSDTLAVSGRVFEESLLRGGVAEVMNVSRVLVPDGAFDLLPWRLAALYANHELSDWYWEDGDVHIPLTYYHFQLITAISLSRFRAIL